LCIFLVLFVFLFAVYLILLAFRLSADTLKTMDCLNRNDTSDIAFLKCNITVIIFTFIIPNNFYLF